MKSVLVVFLCIALSACSPKQEQATAKRSESATIIVPNAGPVSSDPAKPEAAAPQFASEPPAQIAALTMKVDAVLNSHRFRRIAFSIGWRLDVVDQPRPLQVVRKP